MLSDLFSFEGRNNRAKFWITQFAIIAFLMLVALIDIAIIGNGEEIGILYIVAGLSMIIPLLANQVKRWHDRDKSGWWILIAFVPIIGSIWVFIETGLLRGTDGPNKYGLDPLNPNIVIEKQPDNYI